MAERKSKLKNIGRSASTESTEYSLTMGKSVRRKKPKERWLLSRKTWRYMADAGRKLIPDGAKNCPEDIPKIEAYFQEVCKREPRFLLWRKNSYPGALSFKNRRKQSRKGGSCRKAVSADEVDLFKPERPKNLALEPKQQGKFNLKQMREEFLNSPQTPTDYSRIGSPPSEESSTEEETQLVNMLEQYLRIADTPTTSCSPNLNSNFNYQDLIDKLQRHLTSAISSASVSRNYEGPSYSNNPSARQHVHFQGDHVQRSQWDTLSRYFSQCSNRDKIISDLLTDRKALEKLYFALRKARNFQGSRGGGRYTNGTDYSGSFSRKLGDDSKTYHMIYKEKSGVTSPVGHPPPLIEVESETIEITYRNWSTQTTPVPECVLQEVEAEFKKHQAEQEEEEARESGNKPSRRRSSVDHDDVSQSVSDTIKRYLRMARKKSADGDKADRFKRVNYDRNLRNIKAKGEITKPGDDDGLSKGCQTNDDWILTYRDLKLGDQYDLSDLESQSRLSSTRSSIDGVFDGVKSTPSSPPSIKSGSHSFLAHLLHGKHDKQEKSMTANSMQKSKSSSSVMQQGGRLVAKKIFRSRSKSQTRPAQSTCGWIPKGSGVWNSISGRQVILNDTNLLHLTEIERKVLQKVAIAKLQALNLGCTVKVPTEHQIGVPTKSKRRPYLLRKAKTTGIFDANRKECEKEGAVTGGLVFGIPINQCVENDRLARVTGGTGSPLRSRIGSSGDEQGIPAANLGRRGSRSSFSSLIDSPRGEEIGSCESLRLGRKVGSVPGLLDALSCGSVTDIPGGVTSSEEDGFQVPNVISECIRHLEHHGLHTSGIFRVSASKKRLRQLREDFDCGKEVVIDDEQCVHDVANLLKEYLRDLPDPLLCRDLYNAFVQTQRIRNRRLQLEALQHLVQLLPPANRDTLYALLNFLASVARNANDSKTSSGEEQTGNKMDSNNLATVFAPNILHYIKPGGKDTTERSEDRLDVINVVRGLIDHFKQIFLVPAALLDEVYIYMMDSHPEALDKLLHRLDCSQGADESVDELDSECNSAPWTPTHPTSEVSMDNAFDPKVIASLDHPKRTYSREECLHGTAATGGPNIGMRIRHKDRIKERSIQNKKRDGSSSGGLFSRMKNPPVDEEYHYQKNRSSSLESTSSHTDSDMARVLMVSDENGGHPERRQSTPYLTDNSGVLTASLTIPVHQYIDDDIPYIEDSDTAKHQLSIGVVRVPTVPPRKRNTSVGSDSSVSSIHPITASLSLGQGHDSAIGSTTSYSSSVQNTPTSVSSSMMDPGIYSSPPSWTSSPPTSPTSLESTRTSVSYTPDEIHVLKPAPKGKHIGSKDSQNKVSFASNIEKSKVSYQRESSYTPRESNQKYTPTISSIGNAVMKSKTADFERISKVENKQVTNKPSNCSTSTSSSGSTSDKKKYTKRRYTDTRHPTQHIPDSDALESSSNKAEIKPSVSPTTALVYKRRELISSAHKK